MSSGIAYTAEMVEGLASLLEASELLEQSGIPFDNLETLEEVKAVLLHRIRDSNRSEMDTIDPVQVSSLMRTIIERDQAMRHDLSKIYLELSTLMTHSTFDVIILDELNTIYGGGSRIENTVLDMLLKQNSELVNEDCPIIVAGETSAGKSSFLNLLIGDDLLPNSLLCATSTICRLVNDEEKKYTIIFAERNCNGDLNKEETLRPDCTGEMLRKKLDKYVNATDRDNNIYKIKEVVIHWPIPILQGNVSIVDTPGIGESDEMTRKVVEFLPRAVAFIYIINSATAGGVQEDRLVRLLQKQIKDKSSQYLNSFDPTSAIFICNKWDAVPDEEKVTVDLDTRRKLSNIWRGFQQSQLFHLSITEALRYQKGGFGTTELYRKLLDGIKELIPHSLEIRAKSHHSFLVALLRQLEKALLSRISHSRRSYEERKEKEKNVRERLDLLRHKSYEIMESLRQVMEQKENDLVERLHAHLHHSETMRRLKKWNDAIITKDEDTNSIIEAAKDKIQARIFEEISNWDRDTRAMESIYIEIQEEFRKTFKLMETEFQEISGMFLANQEDEEVIRDQLPRDHLATVGHMYFGFPAKLTVGVTIPLLIPLAIFLPEIIIPFIAGVAIFKFVSYRWKLQKYHTNQAQLMEEWTKAVLDKLTKKVIRENIVREQLCQIHDVWRTYKGDIIPRRIEADDKLLTNLANDQRTYSSMTETYGPQLEKCRKLIQDTETYDRTYKCV